MSTIDSRTIASVDLGKSADDLKEYAASVRRERGLMKRAWGDDSSLSTSLKRAKPVSEATFQTALSKKGEVALPNLDRDAFYKRLSTFSSAYVSRKRPINALQCAMHGFIDTQYRCGEKQDVCKLICESCHCSNFVIDITPYQPKSQKVAEIIKRYEDSLSTFHREDCFWRHNSCPDEVYSFPLRTSTQALDLIASESRNFRSCEGQLPIVEHPLDDSQMEHLEYFIRATENAPESKYIFSPDIPLEDTIRTAYILPMFGWRHLTTDSGENALRCHHCLHEVNLAELHSSAISNDTLATKFDVVKGHREYCPWVNRRQALVKTPRSFALNKDAPLCGYEWMAQIVEMECSFIKQMRATSAAYRESRLKYYRDSRLKFRETGKAMMARLREMGSTLKAEESKSSLQPRSSEEAETDNIQEVQKGEEQQREVDHIKDEEMHAEEEHVDISIDVTEKEATEPTETVDITMEHGGISTGVSEKEATEPTETVKITIEQPKEEETVAQNRTNEASETLELDVEDETMGEYKAGEAPEELNPIEQPEDLTELDGAADLAESTVEDLQKEDVEIADQEANTLEAEDIGITADTTYDNELQLPEADEATELQETLEAGRQAQEESADLVEVTEEEEVERKDQPVISEVHEEEISTSPAVASNADELAEFASTPAVNLQDDEALLDTAPDELQAASPAISVSLAADTPKLEHEDSKSANVDDELNVEENQEGDSAEIDNIATPQVLEEDFDLDDILEIGDADEAINQAELENLDADNAEVNVGVAFNVSDEHLESTDNAQPSIEQLESDRAQHEEQPSDSEAELEQLEHEGQATAEEVVFEQQEQQVQEDKEENVETTSLVNEEVEDDDSSANKISNVDTPTKLQDETTSEAQISEQPNTEGDANKDGEQTESADIPEEETIAPEEGLVPAQTDHQEDNVVPASHETEEPPKKSAGETPDIAELEEGELQQSEDDADVKSPEAGNDENNDAVANADSSEAIQEGAADENDRMEEDILEESATAPEEAGEEMDTGIEEATAEVNEEMDTAAEQLEQSDDEMEFFDDEKATNDVSADIDMNTEDKDASIVIEQWTESDQVVSNDVAKGAKEMQEGTLVDADAELSKEKVTKEDATGETSETKESHLTETA